MKPLSAARPGAHERVEIRLAAGTYALRETLVLGPEDGGPWGAGERERDRAVHLDPLGVVLAHAPPRSQLCGVFCGPPNPVESSHHLEPRS